MTAVTRKPSAGRWTYERAAPTPGKVCKDCVTEAGQHPLRLIHERPAPHPGPRCTTHHRAFQRASRLKAAGRRISSVYGITEEQYQALYESQGRHCAFCPRTGASKRLAVDHDHACCIGPKSCGKCVRGLVCSTCNDVLAHFRDNPLTFEKAADYLRNWPSERAGITGGRAGIRRV